MPYSSDPNDRILAPSRSYDLVMTIGDLNYSNDLIKVRIVSSIATAYQLISIDLVLDQSDILYKKLYGKESIELKIIYFGRDGRGNRSTPLEQISFTLMQIADISVVRTTAPVTSGKVKELSKVSLLTVVTNAFITMTTMVNTVINGKTPGEIIKTLVKETDATLELDENDLNINRIDQFLIPPMTLYQAISYLDNHMGIYDGGACSQGFCQYDNTIQIFNLSKKINDKVAFIIYHLSIGGDNQDIFDKSYDGNIYYTFHNIDSEYFGNVTLANYAKNITYNIKPLDSLYYQFKYDFIEVCKSYGVYTGNSPDIYFDKNLSNREVFRISHTGEGLNTAFARSDITRQGLEISELNVYLERNLQIKNLLRVGEAVMLESRTLEYRTISGNYILKTSDITFNKETMDWMSFAVLTLNRSNKLLS